MLCLLLILCITFQGYKTDLIYCLYSNLSSHDVSKNFDMQVYLCMLVRMQVLHCTILNLISLSSLKILEIRETNCKQ